MITDDSFNEKLTNILYDFFVINGEGKIGDKKFEIPFEMVSNGKAINGIIHLNLVINT